LLLEIDSQSKAISLGDPIRVAGHALDVQFACPVADIIGLEVSNDRATWHFATDADGADIDGPTIAIAVDDYREVRERPEWIRLRTYYDQQGPRLFRALIGVHKVAN